MFTFDVTLDFFASQIVNYSFDIENILSGLYRRKLHSRGTRFNEKGPGCHHESSAVIIFLSNKEKNI